MTVTLKCGCVVWIDHYSAWSAGCCCGECYIYDYGSCEAEGGNIEIVCDTHSGLDNAE